MRSSPSLRPVLAMVMTSFAVACSARDGSSGPQPDSGNGRTTGYDSGSAQAAADGEAADAGVPELDATIAASDGAADRADSDLRPGSDAADVSDAGGSPSFRVFMIASTSPIHAPMSTAAVPVVEQLGVENNFTVDSTTDTSLMTDANLAKYQVFLQMQLGSFEMPSAAQAAFEKYIGDGKGWVGVHAAGLTGMQFVEDAKGNVIPGYTYWPWYTTFFGGVIWSTHPSLQNGMLLIEDRTHPATMNLPASFQLLDEWYEWAQNPRPNVHVLGRADESTYTPVHPAGDHPIVWSNEHEPRMIYIGVGHDPSSLANASYRILLRDSILWAARR